MLPAALLALLLPGLPSPPPQPSAPGRARVLAAAREVAARARYAVLGTLDGGAPVARVVDPAPPEGPDFTVWIATQARTRKVAQLGADGRASLAWFDRGGMATLTLLGRATLVTDPGEKARRWRKAWAPFYPGGARDPGLVLIRFQPSSLEIFSSKHGLASDPATWRPVTLAWDAPPPEPR